MDARKSAITQAAAEDFVRLIIEITQGELDTASMSVEKLARNLVYLFVG